MIFDYVDYRAFLFDSLNFIQTKNSKYSAIPESIKLKIKDLKVTINFSDKSGRDKLFISGLEDHQHKIVVQLIQINTNGIKALFAHEFFHAVHFEINPDEATWVREGMTQLFEYFTTDELNRSNLRAAIDNPLTPLIGKYDIDNANLAFERLFVNFASEQVNMVLKTMTTTAMASDITRYLDGHSTYVELSQLLI
ncbi:MAG: hypothetical protein H7281_07965 [Bacteriovorax sp.]|nr:hypothetical protein [Bacteriovorax sp.]